LWPFLNVAAFPSSFAASLKAQTAVLQINTPFAADAVFGGDNTFSRTVAITLADALKPVSPAVYKPVRLIVVI